MAVAMIGPKFYAWDRNGKPLAFGKLYTYEARTNVPKPTYQSEDQVVENTNPVILNGEGYANVYLDGSYKMVLKDEKDNEIWSSDPVSSNQATEWNNCRSATYISPTAFSIVGNVTNIFEPGRAVRIDTGGSNYTYGYIESSVFAANETSVQLTEPVVTTGIQTVCVSIVGPQSTGLISDRRYSAVFSTLDKLKGGEANDGVQITPSLIDYSDVLVKTISYHGGWAAQLVPFGGAEYILTTLQSIRDSLEDQTWEPDGFGDHYLFGGTQYVAKIKVAGFTDVDAYGAKPNDSSFDNASVFYAASVAARALADGINLGNNNINPRPFVRFTPGVTYYQYSTMALDVESVRIDFRCEGICNISGAKPDTPSTRTALCWSFNRVYRTTFEGFNFAGFDKIHEWDTNNADQCTVVYDNCDFFDCGEPGTPVIDTRSFAESRSTDLSFINCRCSFVPMLLDCYCDTLRFEGGIYRNFDDSGCLIQADSLVTTIGGMFVPTQYGNDARWFDLYDNGTTGTRGFNSQGTRFSPEAGGIPIIYNFMSGQDTATNHLTNFITFDGGANSASSGTFEGALVVLQDDGVNSYAPSIIGFYGASVRSNSGLVRTKNNKPVGKAKGRFAIEVSMASQSHLADIDNSVSIPLVEDILRPYLVGMELYNQPIAVASGGSTTTIDLVDINAGPQPIIQVSGSSATIDGITNAFDGQIITLEFLNAAATVLDNSNGSRIFLNGGVDFTTNAFGSLTLRWHRGGDKWFEIGRSSR